MDRPSGDDFVVTDVVSEFGFVVEGAFSVTFVVPEGDIVVTLVVSRVVKPVFSSAVFPPVGCGGASVTSLKG